MTLKCIIIDDEQLAVRLLESFVEKKGMTASTKACILTTVTILMGVGFFVMSRKGIWVPCIILAVVWTVHMVYFLLFVKTIKQEAET